MKFVHLNYLIILVSWCMMGCQNNMPRERSFSIIPDTTSILKNPAMGWVMYCEGWELYPYFQDNFDRINVNSFWEEMDAVRAHEVSNILYIRAVWSAFESEEGKYAWEDDPNFIQLVEGAKERNLKLAFRIFHDSRDMVQQATPEYVFKAGASFKTVTGKDGEFKTPYYDDQIFQKKFDTFLQAFAKKFDDPQTVDFIDAYGLGRWGEGHGVILKNKENYYSVVDWITSSYAKSFKKILTVLNVSEADYKYTKPLAFDRYNFIPRRDGLGSYWFSKKDQEILNSLFPQSAFIGEACYWFTSPTGDTLSNRAFEQDKQYKFKSFKATFPAALDDALKFHSNTMDLRVPLECKYWIEELPELVQKFISHGGYRLYPSKITVLESDDKLSITHVWKNLGLGVLPNNHPNWNQKYQVAFALFDDKGKLKKKWISKKAEPSKWVKGVEGSYSESLSLNDVARGSYQLAVAIVDISFDKQPGIKLAVDQKNINDEGWLQVGELTR
ncbi:hypothetical protein [Sunxiuqinia sp. sy24]|uniref:hypothetical protein n=1 Tax=Sunxiuqinia sp. sy24 TaxID=3461495 RepID=UPI004045DB85